MVIVQVGNSNTWSFRYGAQKPGYFRCVLTINSILNYLFFKEIKKNKDLFTWWPTSHIILSSGVSKTWCKATVKSTTPKLELKWPPVFATEYTISALSSAANCSRSCFLFEKNAYRSNNPIKGLIFNCLIRNLPFLIDSSYV